MNSPSRQAFEAFMRSRMFTKWDLGRNDLDQYKDYHMQAYWEVWQAAPVGRVDADLLKAEFKRVANERVEKWERLDNEDMIEQAKADAVTGYGMLCTALDAHTTIRPQESKWISMDERKPADEEICIVSGPLYNNYTKGRFVDSGKYDEALGLFINYEGDELYMPSHWMPLPAAPEV